MVTSAFSLASYDNMAPSFSIEIGGQEISDSIYRTIESVEYEQAEGAADVAKITLANPDFLLTDLKMFQPGNEISIWMGYGTKLTHIGRVILRRPLPSFPSDGIAKIQLIGYSKECVLMNNSPEESINRTFVDMDYADVVKNKAAKYKLDATVKATGLVSNMIQKAGMTDYELIKGLSNIVGYLFWVEGTAKGQWKLYFIDEDMALSLQEKKYTFKYNDGNNTSLLSFEPEYLINDSYTKIKVIGQTEDQAEAMEEIIEEQGSQPDIKGTGSDTADSTAPNASGGAVKLFIGDYSFDVMTAKRFKTSADLKAWATQWFRRTRDNFIIGKGTTIGIEDLRVRQIHSISNVSKTIDGDYYFTVVRHIMNNSNGYTCEFTSRKVL